MKDEFLSASLIRVAIQNPGRFPSQKMQTSQEYK
jgi:hypothetical protein